MKLSFVSNYINHHQIPFCNALYERLGEDFTFIETMPMEEERLRMGWGVATDALSFVRRLYEEEAACRKLILESDVVILGWTEREDVDMERLESGRLTFRMSERIYREGRWKMVSPRGLVHKYKEHTRFRNADAYLLCAGAYVAGDFSMIRAYPDRMFRFGYFPPVRGYDADAITAMKAESEDGVRLLYAGRFLELKRPDYCLRLAGALRDAGMKYKLTMIGDGEQLPAMKQMARELHIEDAVEFCGMLPPEKVRDLMEAAQIFLFPSNHLEGWGAVVNEAMNSACLVVASNECGAAPFLIRHKENGLMFRKGSFTDFAEQVKYGMVHADERLAMGRAACDTIMKTWNATAAAEAFLDVSEKLLRGERDVFLTDDGPMSRAEVI